MSGCLLHRHRSPEVGTAVGFNYEIMPFAKIVNSDLIFLEILITYL